MKILVMLIFFCDEMDILSISLNDINVDEEDPDTIIHVRRLACHIKLEKRTEVKNHFQ